MMGAKKIRKGPLVTIVALLGLGGAVAAMRRYGSASDVLAAAATKVKATAGKAKRVVTKHRK